MQTTNETPSTELATRWQSLRAETPNMRTRDAATRLGVSEAELVATLIGTDAVRISIDGLLQDLVSVGRCMALTRNELAVSEVKGTYGGVEIGPHAGQVIGEHIDLRVFMSQWKHAFAINEAQKEGQRRRSIHVFDASGTAVHKVYLETDGDATRWDEIVAARTVSTPLVIEPALAKRPERPDSEVDLPAFLAAWDGMIDTHQFFHLLAAHRVSRTQALRLAGEARARQVNAQALSSVLFEASDTHTKIMIFVGNRGCLQVFSGVVGKIVRHGPWINVMDPGFNLHLREDKIASSWVVAKPTKAGTVRSLELYDADGETIALVFRKRDDRENPEDPAWHALLDRLVDAP
jgi:putative hemin transport protein